MFHPIFNNFPKPLGPNAINAHPTSQTKQGQNETENHYLVNIII
jgi:hypothetical protein